MKHRLKKLKDNILKLIISIADIIILPGFKGKSLYYVGSFFIKGIVEGALSMRAASVAYSLFIAIFPTLIFIFSLIPFIPIDNFQNELLLLLENILPDSAYNLFHLTISDTIMHQRSNILSIGFFLMLFFSSNGIVALIDAFNISYHVVESRSFISERLISIFLVLILSILLIVAITLIVMGGTIFDLLVCNYPAFDTAFMSILFTIIRWFIIIMLYFMAISFLYYLAPSKKGRFKFITPGAIFATFFQIIAVLGFSFYVNNFAQYNKLYGSIGTVIVVMLLFYITALVLILGFELNIITKIHKPRISSSTNILEKIQGKSIRIDNKNE